MIDDASSELLARFVPHDSSEENRRLLAIWRKTAGPRLHRPRQPVCEHAQKQRRGGPKTLPPTQIGRALEELGIEPITAYSPQAKGRVFSTAQDRQRRSSKPTPIWTASSCPGGTPRCGSPRLIGSSPAGASWTRPEPRRGPTGRQRLHIQGKRYQIDPAAVAGRAGAPGERSGRQAGGALRQARLTRPESDAEKKAAGQAPGVPRRKGRLDEGLRPAGFRHPAGRNTSRCAG